MSWKTINEILGLAIADENFYEHLQKDPLQAIQEQGFQLTEAEQEAFRQLPINDLAELSQYLIEQFGSEK